MDGRMKAHVAYCATPRAGGVYTHYRALRDAMTPQGWRISAVSAGRRLMGYAQDGFGDEGCVRVAENTDDPQEIARAFCEWCEREHIRVVLLTSPEYSLPVWNAVRHVPSDVRVISSVHGITPFSYRSVLIHPKRLSALIASSRRQEVDMKKIGAMASERIHLIPHAVQPDFLEASARRTDAQPSDTVRLGYAGRMVNADKGIFLLPDVAQILTDRNIPWTMDMVGAGPDEEALRKRFAQKGMERQVTFYGQQPRDGVLARMIEWDIFLMPSYHEGFGIALIEAMAAGAVPVAHRIRDVTDWIVEHGQTGYLVKPGDTEAMANAVVKAYADRAAWKHMQEAARESVRRRFSAEHMATAYDALFTSVLAEPDHFTPLPWERFEATRFERSWWNRAAHALLPRVWRGRIGQSMRKYAG